MALGHGADAEAALCAKGIVAAERHIPK